MEFFSMQTIANILCLFISLEFVSPAIEALVDSMSLCIILTIQLQWNNVKNSSRDSRKFLKLKIVIVWYLSAHITLKSKHGGIIKTNEYWKTIKYSYPGLLNIKISYSKHNIKSPFRVQRMSETEILHF